VFKPEVYIQRRNQLKKDVKEGIILFIGNEESPMNYTDNPYHFRQDSSFLYFWGLDFPGLAAVIDVDADKDIIFGDNISSTDIICMGPQPSISEKGLAAGVKESAPADNLHDVINTAKQSNRPIHFLPQYRAENILKIEYLLNIPSRQVNENVSAEFIKAVAAQRSYKSEDEIIEIEKALEITYEMHMAALKKSKPGMYEREIAGMMEGIAFSMGGMPSFPIIFSIHGETLHNHYHGNRMSTGDIVVNDCGAESAMHYGGDITRTIPIGGRFSPRQKDIYNIVTEAIDKAISASKPGILYKDVHITACKILAAGLKDLGLMKGDLDEAVHAGAHALFFQCGLGHMMGLDIHDMEGLGEDFVGYTEQIKRNPQFGICSLRLGKALEPGFVITVEPGLYFIPELIDRWKAERKLEQFINYDQVEKYKDFGGVRLEDDILITNNGNRILGRPIPRDISEVEALASS